MGIDVRYFVEYRRSADENWIGFGEFHPERNTELIDDLRMLGELRGVPKKYSVSFFERAFVYIAEEEEIAKCIGDKYCTKQLANNWVKQYGSKIYHSSRTDADWILDPEFESTSWLLFSEFKAIIENHLTKNKLSVDYEAICSAMEVIENCCDKNSTRLIFWYC
ncbi:hypothetical protein [Celerinatantimonas sp. MCCC 1A17872]|uniref:hypothetical protein n=1 Tax=Celerinatantimonas sp. MCCC 1A17872 TaxID=3177514 RepID=UPI0038C2EEDA